MTDHDEFTDLWPDGWTANLNAMAVELSAVQWADAKHGRQSGSPPLVRRFEPFKVPESTIRARDLLEQVALALTLRKFGLPVTSDDDIVTLAGPSRDAVLSLAGTTEDDLLAAASHQHVQVLDGLSLLTGFARKDK